MPELYLVQNEDGQDGKSIEILRSSSWPLTLLVKFKPGVLKGSQSLSRELRASLNANGIRIPRRKPKNFPFDEHYYQDDFLYMDIEDGNTNAIVNNGRELIINDMSLSLEMINRAFIRTWNRMETQTRSVQTVRETISLTNIIGDGPWKDDGIVRTANVANRYSARYNSKRLLVDEANDVLQLGEQLEIRWDGKDHNTLVLPHITSQLLFGGIYNDPRFGSYIMAVCSKHGSPEVTEARLYRNPKVEFTMQTPDRIIVDRFSIHGLMQDNGNQISFDFMDTV